MIRQAQTTFFLFIILFLTLPACGPATSHYVRVDQALARGDYEKADGIVEKSKGGYGSRSDLIYLLDRGMTLQLAGRYAESNRYFDGAERKIDELFATSISEEVSSFALNDNTVSYEGEDFERVMINIFSALNYVELGELDDALVEARKVDYKLTLLNDRHEKKNVYKSDALAQYLSGILYESRGETNDAYISYVKAFSAFKDYQRDYKTPIPPFIGSDLIRTADAMAFSEEKEGYLKRFPEVPWESEKSLSQKAEVVLVVYAGRSPVKVDRIVTIPIPDGAGGVYPVRIAFPQFVAQPSQTRGAEIRSDQAEGPAVRAYLVEDVTAIAVKNLDDRIARISAKAIARATAKAVAALKIRQEAAKSGSVAKELLANISTSLYSIGTERADKRSWRTLPGEVFLGRMVLEPGTHHLKVRYLTGPGGLIEEREFEVTVKSGEKKFLIDRVMN